MILWYYYKDLFIKYCISQLIFEIATKKKITFFFGFNCNFIGNRKSFFQCVLFFYVYGLLFTLILIPTVRVTRHLNWTFICFNHLVLLIDTRTFKSSVVCYFSCNKISIICL